MALYNFIESLLLLVAIFETRILESLGYTTSLLGENEVVPWFFGWPLSIWIIFTMLIAIIMMVKRAFRFVMNMKHKFSRRVP